MTSRNTAETVRQSRWFPDAVVILAGLSTAIFVRAVLVSKGVPVIPPSSTIVLIIVASGLLFFLLGILSRCVQATLKVAYRTVRSSLSLSFLPALLLWAYVIVHAPPALIYVAAVKLLFVATTIAILLRLRRQPKETPGTSLAGIAGRAAAYAAAFVVLAMVGISVFDFLLVRDLHKLPERYSFGDDVRSVRISPLTSQATTRLHITEESLLHGGFGVSPELFQAIPCPITFDISISAPHQDTRSIFLKEPERTVLRQRIDMDSTTGWRESTIDLADYAGASVDITMNTKYETSSIISEMYHLLKYYARLLLVPGFRFDVRQRMALWIAPFTAKKRTENETNVILIGIDALRSDHVSAYGYPRETTPNIDALARDGLLFSNCHTAAPWTLPSFFSIVTSTYPSIHTYGTNFTGLVLPQYGMARIWTIGTISPDYSIKTLAETLAEHEYYTAAFVNNPFLSTEHEFDRGFDEFSQYGPTSIDGNREILPWLDKHRDEQFFLFIHIMDPHDYSIKHSEVSKIPLYFDDGGTDELQTAINRYDTIIHFCDNQIGLLAAHLKELGLDRNTLIVITADHGEELRDHGSAGHGQSLYEELLRVPLIFHLPGKLKSAETLTEYASTVDIAPTILDILGLPLPPYYQGKSLLPSADGKSLPPRPIFAEAVGSGHKKRAVLMDGYKLIYTTNSNTFELYNLTDDPKETHNLISRLPGTEQKLKEALQSFVMQSNRGFQVVLKPPPGLEMCEGTLTTDGSFIRVRPLDLTKPQNFRTSPDSKEILFRLQSAYTANGLVFEVDPPDVPIRLDLNRKSGQPPVSIYLGAPPGEPLSSPVALDREMLRTPHVSQKPDMTQAGLYVWLQEAPGKTKPVVIGDKTKEKLEALGYLN